MTGMADRAVLSVHTKPETRERLEALARVHGRSKSALANEAIEQYLAHQEWLIQEIGKGVEAADRGELIPDDAMETWFRSIGATS
jgi:RHH-type transcriptional regulator, rel operon repressor / antitoxin RelB